MSKTSQSLSEMIIVRLNNIRDGDVVQGIFLEMTQTLKTSADQPDAVRLLKNVSVANEWAIYFHNPQMDSAGKSDLADNLAGMLRSVGMVHRTVWQHCDARPQSNEFQECREIPITV